MSLFAMGAMNEHHHTAARAQYRKPAEVRSIPLASLLTEIGRPPLDDRQFEFLRDSKAGREADVHVYYTGDLGLLRRPCVSVVGTREVSAAGRSRTHRLARELADASIVIVSGLAKGVD